MNIIVLDACVLIAYLFDEEGADAVQSLLIQARENEIRLVMHFVNLGEVYYDIVKRNDVTAARRIYQQLKELPIRFESSVSDQMIWTAGELKNRYRMSYADALAAAQALLLNAELLTADHKEFEPLQRDGAMKIKWFR